VVTVRVADFYVVGGQRGWATLLSGTSQLDVWVFQDFVVVGCQRALELARSQAPGKQSRQQHRITVAERHSAIQRLPVSILTLAVLRLQLDWGVVRLTAWIIIWRKWWI
jgi:hypothetical protein